MFKLEARFSCLTALLVAGCLALPAVSDAQQASAEQESEQGLSPGGSGELSRLVEAAVEKRIRPLLRELRALKEEVRLHDVLGGIGYIVGAAGLAFFFLGARGKERRRSGGNLDNEYTRRLRDGG